MKKLLIIIPAIVVIVSAGYFVSAAETSPAKVVAYYFHGTFRCYTCNNMEKFSREAIDANFKEALASGKLEFRAVNVEESANAHFVKDYKLYTKSLILSLVKDGKEVRSKNLDKIWELSRNREKFHEYVAREVSGFMEDVK